MQELQIGRVYRHFKGDYYLVEGLAHDSESGVPCVIYRKLYGDGGLWVRPLEMFLSRVDREKYPEVRQEYRFQLQEIAKGRLAHATYGAYQGLLKSTIVPYFRKKKLTLRELEARHLQMFYSEMLRRVTPNTVIHYHAVIHSALKYAVKTDMLIQNVADKVDRPRKNSFQPVFLSADEMQKMFEALRGTKLELPVLVAAFYGLRRSEALGLKWDAIDFERDTITIKHIVTNAKIDGKCEIVCADRAKTKSSLRSLPLVSNIREKLLALREQQKENRRVCGNCYSKKYDGYVFVDAMGNIFNPRSVTANFSKLLEQNGLRHIRFHDLRHPYVKHTTINLCKSRNPKLLMVVWDFYFCISKLHTKIKKYQSEAGISATMLIRILFLQFNRRCC